MADARGRVTGVLLAAGAGRRAGGPKALRHDPDPATSSAPSTSSGHGGVSWLRRSVSVLLQGGCAEVVVVLGSRAAEARSLLDGLDARVRVVEAPDWGDGMSRSLVAGLAAVSPLSSAAVVHLVDLPDVTAAVVRRVLAAGPVEASSLARATFDGRPGHPVLIGADHLVPLIRDLDAGPADAGARHYLSQQQVILVECGDLATGQDQDGLG